MGGWRGGGGQEELSDLGRKPAGHAVDAEDLEQDYTGLLRCPQR